MSMDAIGNAASDNDAGPRVMGARFQGERIAPDLLTRRQERPRHGWLEYAVPPAMLVVALAMAVASHLHLGLTPEYAAIVGLALFCVMMLCHVLLRAADAADRAAEEAAEQRTAQVPSPMPIPPMPPAPAMPSASSIPNGPLDAEPRAGATTPVGALPRHQTELAELSGSVAAPPPLATPAHASTPAPEGTGVAGAGISADMASPPGTTAAAQPEPAPRPPAAWRFRPVDLQLPTEDEPATAAALPPLGEIRPARPSADQLASVPDDRINSILKRLAVQIRTGIAQPPANAAAQVPSPGPVAGAAAPDAPAAAALPINEPEAAATESALSNAVDALRSTVEAMRTGGPDATAATPPPVAPLRPDPTDAEIRLAAVAEALAAERANVFLEPILALAEDQARHFEVSVRLLDSDGGELDARALAASANAATGAGGAGLLPVLDALGLRHAAGFALKLERRGRDGTVFSQVAGQSLGNDAFVSDAAGRHAQGIADRLVLTFAQDEMRGLGPAQLAALGDLARLGFRFALQDVADLDMDFEALQALGVQFVKLDAAVFLNGLQAGNEEVPASDICRFFGDMGLAVIVSGIDDAMLRARIEGCGVAFGQGLLFGMPRPIPVGTATSAGIAA